MKLTPDTITAETLGGWPITGVDVSLPKAPGDYRTLRVVMRSETYGAAVQTIDVTPGLLEDDRASELIRAAALDSLQYHERERAEGTT